MRMLADDTSLFIEFDDRLRIAELIEQSYLAEHPSNHMDGIASTELRQHKHVDIIFSLNKHWLADLLN